MNIKIKTGAKTKEENQEIASFLSKVLITVFDNREDFSILGNRRGDVIFSGTEKDLFDNLPLYAYGIIRDYDLYDYAKKKRTK